MEACRVEMERVVLELRASAAICRSQTTTSGPLPGADDDNPALSERLPPATTPTSAAPSIAVVDDGDERL
eukprot:7004304-Pyramimonas_sp.AAC.1